VLTCKNFHPEAQPVEIEFYGGLWWHKIKEGRYRGCNQGRGPVGIETVAEPEKSLSQEQEQEIEKAEMFGMLAWAFDVIDKTQKEITEATAKWHAGFCGYTDEVSRARCRRSFDREFAKSLREYSAGIEKLRNEGKTK
jgi:hypothetical protein